jgi:hypothetical protein
VSSAALPSLELLGPADLEALRLASQVLAHKAALAGLARVEMFFMSIEADAVAEAAARGQRGERQAMPADPWRTAPLTPVDRAAIRAYLELLRDNERLSPGVREHVRRLVAAGRVS